MRNYSQIKKEFRIVLREEKRGNQAKAFFYQPKKYRILEYNKANLEQRNCREKKKNGTSETCDSWLIISGYKNSNKNGVFLYIFQCLYLLCTNDFFFFFFSRESSIIVLRIK